MTLSGLYHSSSMYLFETSRVPVASFIPLQVSQYCVTFDTKCNVPMYCGQLRAGEYCPPGTQEENAMSLAACQVNPLSEHASAAGSRSSQATGDTSSSSCKGFKACPAGSYCPDAASITPCEAGRFCPEGSTSSESCNVSVS